MKIVKRIVDAVCLIADLTPGIILIMGGVAILIGARTGVLWY